MTTVPESSMFVADPASVRRTFGVYMIMDGFRFERSLPVRELFEGNPMLVIIVSAIVPILVGFIHANYYGKKIREMEKRGELGGKKKKD